MAAGLSYGANTAARAKLIGTRRQDIAGGSGDTWSLADKGGALHIPHLLNGQTVSEFECNTKGRACEVEEAGEQTKVTMRFNGSALVVMEMRRPRIVQRRFATFGGGQTMELDVTHIPPAGKMEVIRLQRVPASGGGE